MSWILASMLVLGAALLAGFAWYERAHPSSRVLALVATLAALAALGRIAFAPLPNVKPTTDIVLISGYVLGGAPGFAVGAVAALADDMTEELRQRVLTEDRGREAGRHRHVFFLFQRRVPRTPDSFMPR